MSNRKNQQNFGRDVLAYIPVKVLPAIAGLLSIVLLTHNLTPKEYGSYTVVITIAILIVQLCGTWISNSILYLFPDYKTAESQSKFRREVISLQILIVLPAATIAFTAIYFFTRSYSLALIGSALVLGQVMLALMMTFLQAARKIKNQALVVAFQSLFQISALIYCLYYINGKATESLTALVIGVFAGYAMAIITAAKSVKCDPVDRKLISRKLQNDIFTYGAPMCVWFFASQLYTLGDRLLLQQFEFTEQLGQYAAFRDLATGCAGFITMPLLMASHPIIMSKWKNNCKPDEIAQLISQSIILLAVFFVPIIVLVDIAGYELLTSLFGARYGLPSNIMALVVISIFLAAVAMHVQRGLEMTGKTVLMAKLASICAIFSVIAGLIIIPSHGIKGSASVVLLCTALYLTIVTYEVRKVLTLKIPVTVWTSLLLWCGAVEFGIFAFNRIYQNSLASTTILFINILAIFLATTALYFVNYQTRSIAIQIYKSLKKISQK